MESMAFDSTLGGLDRVDVDSMDVNGVGVEGIHPGVTNTMAEERGGERAWRTAHALHNVLQKEQQPERHLVRKSRQKTPLSDSQDSQLSLNRYSVSPLGNLSATCRRSDERLLTKECTAKGANWTIAQSKEAIMEVPHGPPASVVLL